MKPVILSPAARTEMEQAASWYEDQQTGLGLDFLDALEEHLII